ncbi:ATP-binding cassette domain-containing protein [bacterium]|nr:ATP-binding cassette domain-containing protein [bacterium]
MIELREISRRFGPQIVVAPFSWRLERGRTHVLLGPSGCGKSTILRMLIGLIPPTTGEICFDGKRVMPRDWRRLRERIGYVIQDGGLFPHLTAKSNVLLMARQLRWPREQQVARLAELAELTHFPKDALDRYPAQLSGGQKQRVGIMRALLLNPDVVLLDEPLGALDPVIRYDLQTELRQIFQTLQKTVVLVTHDVGEAQFFGDQVMLLRRGKVLQQGTFDDLWHRPADPYVTQFLTAQRVSFESTASI